MRRFEDKTGQQWTIDLTLAEAENLNNAGVDLASALDGDGMFRRLMIDPQFLLAALRVLCQKQMSERVICAEDFGRLFQGESVGDASNAVAEEVIGFFPSISSGLARTIWEFTRDNLVEMSEKAIQAVAAAGSENDSETSGKTVSDSLESSEESTLATTATES